MFSREWLLLFYFLGCIQCKNKEIVAEFSKDKLLRQLDQAIGDRPFNDSLYFLRAQYYYQHSNFKEAQADLRYAIQLDSLAPDYFHLLADAYMDNGESYDGLTTLLRAVKQFPDRIPTLLKLCEFQNILKQFDHSLETIAHILRLDPAQAQAYLMAGINLRDMKDTIHAIQYFIKATSYDDQLGDAWIILGQLNQSRDFKQAQSYFNNAIRIDSNNINTLQNYAGFLQDSMPLTALRLYQKIILLDPTYTEAYLNAGILYFKIDSSRQALAHFEILCRMEPAEPKYYYYRGTVKEALSDKNGAKSDFEQALRLDPGFIEAKKALSTLK